MVLGKRFFISTIVTAVVASGTYMLSNEKRREKVFSSVRRKENTELIQEKAPTDYEMVKVGHSDPYDSADNQMVDEGALYSVTYYNQQFQ